MEHYTIYCSEEQTLKAIELGAPIETYKPIIINSKAGGSFTTPTIETVTAEQMILWLEEQGLIIDVYFSGTDEPGRSGNKMFINRVFDFNEWKDLVNLSKLYPTRKEATLAAIDAALEYLTNNKK